MEEDKILDDAANAIYNSIHTGEYQMVPISRELAGCIVLCIQLVKADIISESESNNFLRQFYECDTGYVYVELPKLYEDKYVLEYMKRLSDGRRNSSISREIAGMAFYSQHIMIGIDPDRHRKMFDALLELCKLDIDVEIYSLESLFTCTYIQEYIERIKGNIERRNERKKKFDIDAQLRETVD